MNKVVRAFLFICLVLFIIILGYYGGKKYKEKLGFRYDDNKVAIRVEVPKDDIDYDLQASLNILKCKYEREGKKVYFSYAGDMYPKELNNAKTNVFVRGYAPGVDKRVARGAHNVYFVHRFEQGYMEEFRNFDEYIATNVSFVEASNMFGISMSYLEPITCIKEKVLSKDSNGILYIYENYNKDFIFSIKKIGNVRIFDSNSYNSLNDEEKLKELQKAKVVVFDKIKDKKADATGVAYAVYELLGYGKDVITNWNSEVDRLGREGKNIRGFRDYNELFMMLLYGVFRK